MTYCTPKNVWDWLNGSSVVKMEVVAAKGDGTTLYYNLDNANILSGSETIRYADESNEKAYLTASTLTSGYTLDYDRGILQLDTSGAATVSNSSVFADYDYVPINHTIMIDIISGSDREIDRKTGRNWNSNSSTTEYLDVEDNEQTYYFTRYYPHLTVSAVAENDNAASDTPNWITRSAGLGNDYLSTQRDKDIGRIRFIDNIPGTGTDKIKVVYTWGYTSVPQEVKRLSILKTIKTMLQNPAFANKIIQGRDNFIPLDLGVIETEIQQVLKELRKFDYDRI